VISREQLCARLTEARLKFQRKTDRSEVWKERNSSNRVIFSMQKSYTEIEVRSILKQANLTREQIEQFLRDCVKT